MTAIVGVLCKDGVVIGTDSSATFMAGRQPTIEQRTDKLSVIDGAVIVAGSGQIGLDQRFSAIVRRAWEKKAFQQAAIEAAKGLSAETLKDFSATFAPKGQYCALVAFPCQKTPQLCEWDPEFFQPELKTERLWYCSIGSAQYITDPFLALMRDVFWEQGRPNLHDGIFAVTWALEHAVLVNPGGVNDPIRLAVLERSKKRELEARMLDDDELDEHRENIGEAKRVLRGYRDSYRTLKVEGVPEIPQP